MIGGKANMPLAAAFCCNCSANFRMVSGSAVAPMTNSTGNWPPPGSAGGAAAKVRMPGMLLTFVCTSGSDLEHGALALAPGLEHQAGEAVVREGDLEGLHRLGHAQQLAVDRVGVEGGLVNGRIGRRLDDAHDKALVLGGRQFLGCQAMMNSGIVSRLRPIQTI